MPEHGEKIVGMKYEVTVEAEKKKCLDSKYIL